MISMQVGGVSVNSSGSVVMQAGPNIGVDPAASVAAEDSLAGFAGMFSGAPDSLAGPDAVIPLTDTLRTTAEYVFGPSSTLIEPEVLSVSSYIGDMLISDNLVFKIVALICFGIYCVSLYLYRSQALTVLNIFRSKLYVDNLLSEHNYTFDNFLNIVITQGLLGASLATVHAMDFLYWREIAATLPGWGIALLVPAVAVGIGLVFLFQSVVLSSAGVLTFNQKFISRLRYLRKINFALFSLIFTPMLLMTAMAPLAAAIPIAVVLGVGLAFIVVFHLIRTYLMFVDENISKLYWFLYLCAVEIFPVTFLVFFFRKFFM